MPAMPWKWLRAAEPEGEYLVLGSRLELKSFLRIPDFIRLTLTIQRQLARSDGLTGYALNAQLSRKTFLTLSAWRDQAALDAFVRVQPHAGTMQRLRPHMAPGVFRTWTVFGASLPPSWRGVQARLEGEA